MATSQTNDAVSTVEIIQSIILSNKIYCVDKPERTEDGREIVARLRLRLQHSPMNEEIIKALK
jgi:hypothetical protein